MDINKFYFKDGEKPLDNLADDGGFCGIFRTIGVIGDSLSSGELESYCEEIPGYHDFYEYSWGQYMARTIGSKVYNFSRGGMTAREFWETYRAKCEVLEYDKLCQAYIIALAVNDINLGFELGNPQTAKDETHNKDNPKFLVCYANIVKKIKSKQPDAKFFFVTLPNDTTRTEERYKKEEEFSQGIRDLAKEFKNTYVIDLRKYGPEYDKKFRDTFFMGGHMTPAGYMLTAKMVMSYIDYIIRKNPKDFKSAGFIGTPYKYNAKE